MMDQATTRPFAVVTGASSGIALALAREGARHDFDLLITATGPDIAESARVAGIRRGGADVRGQSGDL